jgi:hypothetical protein
VEAKDIYTCLNVNTGLRRIWEMEIDGEPRGQPSISMNWASWINIDLAM